MKSLKTLKCSLQRSRTLTILVSGFHLIRIQKRLSLVVHFVPSFSKTLLFDTIHQNFQRDECKYEVSKNFKKYLTPSEQIGDPLQKKGGKERPVLSFATKYYSPTTYCLNFEAIFFATM